MNIWDEDLWGQLTQFDCLRQRYITTQTWMQMAFCGESLNERANLEVWNPHFQVS